MKIDIAKKDLTALRDLVYSGRLAQEKLLYGPAASKRQFDTMHVGTKFIRKLNLALKQSRGHDCSGNVYL